MESTLRPLIEILTSPLVLLFALLTLAYGADRLLRADGRLLPIMILVVAPFIGWIGKYELPGEIRTLGLIMFIYVIGLETGREFFPTFRQHWARFILMGVAASGGAALLAWGIGRLLGWSSEITVSFFAGAVTSTPAFEWLPETLRDAARDVTPAVSTFDLSYFTGVIGAVAGLILFHFIWTRRASELSCPVDLSREGRPPDVPFRLCVHRITNKSLVGKPIARLVMQGIPHAQAIRYERGGMIHEVEDDAVAALDDLVVLFGCTSNLSRLAELLVGPRVEVRGDAPLLREVPVRVETVTVNSPRFAASPVARDGTEDEFGVEVRGWWRGREYHAAEQRMRWRLGDRLHVVGTEEKVKAFRYAVEEKGSAQTEEIDLLRFSVGAAVAMFLSGIVVPVGSHVKLTLGVTGAPLLAGLLFGRSARIQIPRGAGFFLKELGLGLFLAGIGTNVGLRGALSPSDLALLPLALLVVAVPMVMTALVFKFAGFTGQHTEGGLCGAVTSTPALMVSCRLGDTAEPANTYAGIYLFALLTSVVAAQILYLVG